ncbi:uncharacterized protein LOC114335034 isoform X2 [Diabrotica virgifera virgifera]|uniref:Uncharacterized protein LOC114335034 isoform X2 n=1 Tax=Diabrotica virgifera virgifera TaxID=50390 RepID=A0A6P7G1V0_DIAVI|nr:uncharacterized protein LOC114335034 isoform X2 [Diabrotica virgifera virgifera]
MESSITQGYENAGVVSDVNKQISYEENTVAYGQENYPVGTQIVAEGFHVEGDPYNVSHATVYNPNESIQQMAFDQQDQNLQNLPHEAYYTSQEIQLQESCIPEQPLVQEPAVMNANQPVEVSNSEMTNEIITEINETKEEIIDNGTNNGNVDNVETNSNENIENVVEEDNNAIGTETIIQQNIDNNEEESATLKIEDSVQSEEISEQSLSGSTPVSEDILNQSSVTNITESDAVQDTLDGSLVTTEDLGESIERVSAENQVLEESVVSEEGITDMSLQISDNSVNAETVEESMHCVVPEATEIDLPIGGDLIELQNYEAENNQQVQDHYIFTEESSSAPSVSSEGIPASQTDDGTTTNSDKPTKQRRFRKPVHDLPMHLIGHDISKPVEVVPNGRPLPKPRLGVKNVLGKKPKEEPLQDEQSDNEDDPLCPKHEPSQISALDDEKIENDDDLLAILEGDGDGEDIPVVQKESQENEADDSNLKLLEREIALQQLQELPHQEPTEKVVKPRFSRSAPALVKKETKEEKPKPKQSTPSKPTSKSPQQSKQAENQHKEEQQSKSKTQSIKKSSPTIDLPIEKKSVNIEPVPIEKKPVEIEPQVKVNMVLKTYSRKRKPSDIHDFDTPSPKRSAFEDPDANQIYEKGDPLALPSDVYVTKSSRVIKKKVIWDPDDEQTSKPASVKIVDTTKVYGAKTEKSDRKQTGTPTGDKIKSDQKTTPKSAEKNTTEKNIVKKPVAKPKTPLKSKRGLSEVDRLLMDEGAVKMLYDLKSDETPTKKKKTIYSVERAAKDIIKKANVLKNDLVQNTGGESQKTLRKKEGSGSNTSSPMVKPPLQEPVPIMERKMSKDSTRSSVHTPPRSPTFFASQTSMLIRRRSSSSLSSDSESDSQKSKTKSNKKTESSKLRKQKKSTSNDNNNSTPNKDTKNAKSSKEITAKAVKGVQYKSFTMKKSGKHIAIDLHYIDEECLFTIQVLDELTTALKRLEKDKDCNVVSITSTSKAFCLGLDYAWLVKENKNDRVEKASVMAETVREFLLCLLNFSKVLVAGIQGECTGLGVTMLSLFDTVIASDTATFRTPYASLGCLGEATFLLTYPNLNSNGLAAELLYAQQVLKADEAFRRGLISKLCWPEKYKDTLNNFLTSVAKGSRQSLEATKRRLRVNTRDQIEAAINDEVEILIDHWTSPECQENFSKLKK